MLNDEIDESIVLVDNCGCMSDKHHNKYTNVCLKETRETLLQLFDKSVERVIGSVCPYSERVDGLKHSWKFDGDDPNVICHYCGEVVRSGMIIIPGKEHPIVLEQRQTWNKIKSGGLE